tara:strand:- start:115 stop:306 length:192 start_codon:yes stop_codon:yes gene_type:complete
LFLLKHIIDLLEAAHIVPVDVNGSDSPSNGFITRNNNVCNAGEFYVLAQLAQRRYIAGKTDDV